MQAYSNFVQALVERYDGDGVADMPGLRYPIAGWEILNEPETSQHPESETGFFRGSVADYLEILQVTAGAIRAASPMAMIANGGATGADSSYWQQVLAGGGNVFAYRLLGDRQPVTCLWSSESNRNVTLGVALTTNIITRVKITTGVPADESGTFPVEFKTASNGIAVVSFSNTPIYIEEGSAVAASPQSVSVKSGHECALSLTAVGTAPLQYQWMKDGVSLGGMTSSVFHLAVAGKDKEGSYVCRVSNMAAVATSTPAFLSVTEPVAPPDAPSAISASQGDYTDKIVVQWSASDGSLNWATGYRLWRALSNDISLATMLEGIAGTLTTNYTDRNISPLYRYTYWVQATNCIGVAPFSSSASGWCASISQGVCANYDGDGKADPAIYDEATGTWKVKLSSAGYNPIELLDFLGGTGYRAVAADYDGDMKSDPAIYGESNGYWIFKLSSIGCLEIALTQTLGGSDYIPVPADYDGDALADPAVKSETGNEWIVMFSSGGYTPVPLTISFE